MKKDSLFNKWCWENWKTICNRMKLKPLSLNLHKTQLKMDQGPWNETIDPAPYRRKSRSKSSPCQLRFRLPMTPKAQEIKAGINNWDRFKLKSFLSAKETISNVKRERTEWENIFATHTSDRALISRIYKELKEL